MRTLKVIPWDELRRQYHRRRVLIRVAKEISLAVVLGALVGTALAVGRDYGSDGIYGLAGPESVIFRWCAADGNGSVTDLLRR